MEAWGSFMVWCCYVTGRRYVRMPLYIAERHVSLLHVFTELMANEVIPINSTPAWDGGEGLRADAIWFCRGATA